MTTDNDSPTSETTKRSPAVVAIAIILVLSLLGGGGYVIYKLTNKTQRAPAFQVAKDAVAAIGSGNSAKLGDLSTSSGKVALVKITANDVKGLTFGGCKAFPGKDPTRLCVWSRPGGQLSMSVILLNKNWKVDAAEIGPAGLPPAGQPTGGTPPSS